MGCGFVKSEHIIPVDSICRDLGGFALDGFVCLLEVIFSIIHLQGIGSPAGFEEICLGPDVKPRPSVCGYDDYDAT